MPMNRILVSAALLLASLSAWSQEFKPYPQPRVTPQQWQAYFDEVRASYGASMRTAPNQPLVAFDDGKATQFAFTQPGHPAHPSWITRRIVDNFGKPSLEQVGFFAGEEKPFAALYQSYAKLAQDIRESIRRRREGGVP